MNTRAKNATQRPRLVVEKDKKKCRSKEEVQAERQAKEDAKEEKARTKAAGIKRVAAYEQNQANEDAVEATPKAAPQPRALHCTRSYAQIPERKDTVPYSDVEMREPDTKGSIYNGADNNDDERTESVFASPPRKRQRWSKRTQRLQRLQNLRYGRLSKQPRMRCWIRERARLKAVKVRLSWWLTMRMVF
jgi:hypothetical protein